MLCDFFGKVLVEPSEVLHTRCGFDLAILVLREALHKYRIRDQVVAVERTGNYHLPVKRAFLAARFETRIVHPFATKQFRQPADPGNKTDPNDLHAMFRATVTGFGLLEQELDDVSQRLRLLTRHRRDLVEKRSSLCCQVRKHLDALLPGYAALFDDVWESAIAIHVARHFPSPERIRQANLQGLAQSLRAILMMIADNLIRCNYHFRGLNAIWKAQGKDSRFGAGQAGRRRGTINLRGLGPQLNRIRPGAATPWFLLGKTLREDCRSAESPNV